MAAPTTQRPVTQRPVRDRFDAVPDDLHRVGAHRAKAHWGQGWANLAWVVGAILVLSIGGLWGLSQINSDFQFGLPFMNAAEEEPGDAPPADSPEAVEPKLDPAIVITVLNGTGTPGLSNTVGDYLVSQGWEGAAFGVGARVSASASDVEITQVIYNNPDNEAAARAMLETLGVGELVLANTYPASPLAVLIGSDYVLPAG
ncbi:LytR C-terminal domain-containing protein [Homoserinimonas sp. A520]